jgi:hypothetical protein
MKNTTMNRFGLKKSTSTSLSREAQRQRRRLALRKQLVFESLESRHLMAGDLGTFLTQGHVDIDIARSGIEWSVGVNNAESVPETRYANNDAVLYVGATSLIERPDIAQFDFIGVNPGEQFYLLPQNEDPNMLFLGVSAEAVDASTVDRYSPASESKGRVSTVGRWVKATLSDVRHTNPDGSVGTGIFSSWRTGTFGQTTVFMSSLNDGVSNPNGSGLDVTDGISADDAVWIQAGTESHLNFGFSKPGRYEVDLRVSAYFGDDTLSTPNIAGLSTSTPVTLFFSVASSGELQFESATYSVNENAGTASVDVIRVGGSVGKLTVDYATSNGSAIAGSDFTSTIGTLTFGDKETRKTIVIPIIHDATLEPTEAFSLALTSPKPADFHSYRQNIEGDVNGLLGGIASATITIVEPVRATFDRSAVLVSASNPTDVRLADIDNDGDLDVLFVKYITSISILPNNGDGTFGAEIEFPALTVSDIHVADVNGDNRLDIVSSVYVDSTYAETAIAVWRNLGGGNFSGRELVESTRTTAFVGLTGVGDVDGDSLKDLVLSNDGLSWSRNQGDGTFATIVTISTSGINYSSSLRDIDQDGDLDIVQATLANDDFKLQVFRNSGTTNPSFATEQVASFGSIWIGGITIGDTNEDGFADIHLLRDGSNRDILALHGTSTGTFLAPIVLGSGPDLTDLKIGDIDGDGRPDLALTAMEQNQVHFAQNLGSGVFTALQEFTHDGSSLNPYPEAVAIGDIDRDGRNDLVFSERFGTGIAWSRNRSEENITTLTPPASRTYLNGYPMTFDVFLGFNVKLNTSGGSPTLPITIGSQAIQVPFVGQPNANTLRFRYQVKSTDVDLDGIQVANSVVLNGATVTDIHDRLLDQLSLSSHPLIRRAY